MKTLNNKQIDEVAGGVLVFLLGYAAGKVLDAAAEGFAEYVNEFDERDWSESNAAFEPGSGFGTL